MSYLFKVEGNLVYPNDETLLVEPFKTIWERDGSKNKELAKEEFTYMEFMASMKKTNPYRQYREDKKHSVIIEDNFTDQDWKPDELVLKGIERLKSFQHDASTTYMYYLSAKIAAEKMQDFFRHVDITALNPKTMNPIYKPRDITSALNDTEKVLSNLKSLEKKVEEELYEETKTKGGKEISPFANPNSI